MSHARTIYLAPRQGVLYQLTPKALPFICNTLATTYQLPTDILEMNNSLTNQNMDEKNQSSINDMSRTSILARDATFFWERKVQLVFPTRSDDSMCGLPSILKEIKSEKFREFIQRSQLVNPTVELNPYLMQSPDMYQSFKEEGEKCCVEGYAYDVRIVFHGTPECNIDSILCNGLDPSKRRGQAYGPGEYFASSPAMPMNYTRGGKKILVFAVITTKSDIRAREIVVVEKSQRQLPIATISFLNLASSGWTVANTFQAQVSNLLAEKIAKEKIAKEARSKERIIKLLLQGEYYAASDIYNSKCDSNGYPPASWASEVTVYVHDHIRDEETIDIYFPNLPHRPVTAAEVRALNTKKCEEGAKEAKKKYESLLNGGNDPQLN